MRCYYIGCNQSFVSKQLTLRFFWYSTSTGMYVKNCFSNLETLYSATVLEETRTQNGEAEQIKLSSSTTLYTYSSYSPGKLNLFILPMLKLVFNSNYIATLKPENQTLAYCHSQIHDKLHAEYSWRSAPNRMITGKFRTTHRLLLCTVPVPHSRQQWAYTVGTHAVLQYVRYRYFLVRSVADSDPVGSASGAGIRIIFSFWCQKMIPDDWHRHWTLFI